MRYVIVLICDHCGYKEEVDNPKARFGNKIYGDDLTVYCYHCGEEIEDWE